MAPCNSETETQNKSIINQLEERIGEYPFTVENVSRCIKPMPDDAREDEKELTEKDKSLLNRIKEDYHVIFLTAVKSENYTVVNFLIKCGVNVNLSDGVDTAADHASRQKNCKILLSLLEADSTFPRTLKECDCEDGLKIKNLIQERNELHKLDEDNIKNSEVVKKLKLCLNYANESLFYAAIKGRKYNIYGYLKSIGAEFRTDEEKLELTKLENEWTDQIFLHEAMIHYFPSVSNAHILYLISKSRSQKPVADLYEILTHYYGKLDEIREVSLILKVVQYASYLDIIFDFEEDEISKINPLARPEERIRGVTRNKQGRIYIAACREKRSEDEILGTIAHELTHMAMDILYENDCDPYEKEDETSKIFFEEIKKFVSKVIECNKEESKPSGILVDAIKYPPKDHDSELIARVPQILMQFKENQGRIWLAENIKELLQFYERTVLEKCEVFIRQSVILKSKSITKSINEKIGEISRLEKCKINFKKVENFFNSSDKPILLLDVKNTLLGMLKVLQGLYGKNYTNFYKDFLVVKFENFMEKEEKQKEVIQTFFYEGNDLLIIEVTKIPSNNDSFECCRLIALVLDQKPKKKIVFVTHETVVKHLCKKFDDHFLKELYVKKEETELRLDDLDEESQNNILNKRVCFQGRQMLFKNLVEKNLYEFVQANTVETLLEGGKVRIGNRIFGSSSLEASYFDVGEEIKLNVWSKVVKNNPDYIFIVRSDSNGIVDHFKKKIKIENINVEYYRAESYNFEKEIFKETVMVDNRFQPTDFKNFCHANFRKRCHLISVNLEENSFILQQVYNPNFYTRRKFKRIIVKPEIMEKLVAENKRETFIVSCKFKSKDFNFGRVNNVKWFFGEKDVFSIFEKVKEPDNIVHWFQMEEDLFIWINSHGSVQNLRKLTHDDPGNLIDEERFVSEIIHRKILLITGTPGTGKTATLIKLYEAPKIFETHWIIRINPKEARKVKDLTVKGFIQFLQDVEPNLKDGLNKNFLERALTIPGALKKNLLLVFDGFDEILDKNDRKKVINLLKFLKNQTFCKIWITSRSHYKEELEHHLETFAVELHPFDEIMKRQFMENHLNDRLDLTTDEDLEMIVENKIKNFTKGLLSKMKTIFNEDALELVGIPLQLNLVTIGSTKDFKIWIEQNPLDYSCFGDDLLNVYKNFIAKKYDAFFEKSKATTKKQKDMKNNFEMINKNLANSLVYNQEAAKIDENEKKCILSIGLIQSINENFHFIHKTFQEYYFAQSLLEKLLSEKFLKEKINLIFEGKEFIMIRYFFNSLLKSAPPETRIEELKKIFRENEKIMKKYITLDSALVVAAQEGLENLFHLFYSIYISESNEITNILNQPLFFTSVIGGKWRIWHALFQLLNDEKLRTRNWEKFYHRCLIFESARFATDLKSSVSKSLWTKIDEDFSKNDKHYFLNAFNKKYKTLCKIMDGDDSCDIFGILLDIGGKVFNENEQYEFLNTANKFGPNVFFAAASKKNSIYMKLLLQKYGEIKKDAEHDLLMATDESGKTILHVAACNGALEICELILNQIESAEFLIMTDVNNKTALYHSVGSHQIESSRFLIEKGIETLETDDLIRYIKMSEKDGSRTILHLAAESNNIELLSSIFSKISEILPSDDVNEWMMKKAENQSILHSACNGNVDILTFILTNAKETSMLPDKFKQFLVMTNNSNQTFLQLIVDSNRTDMVKLLIEKTQKFSLLENERQIILEGLIPFVLNHTESEILSCLLEYGGNILTPDKEREIFTNPDGNYNPIILQNTVKNGTIDSVHLMLKKSEKYSTRRDEFELLTETEPNMLYSAISNPDKKVFELIFQIAERIQDTQQRELFLMTDTNNQNYLHASISTCQFELLFRKIYGLITPDEWIQLLSHKENANGNTVLHAAAGKNQSRMLHLLLEKIGNIENPARQRELLLMPNNDTKNFFQYLSPEVSLEIAKLIVGKSGEILTTHEKNTFLMAKHATETVFHTAVKFNKTELLKFLLGKSHLDQTDQIELMKKKVKFSPSNFPSDFENTILHIAAYNGNPDTIKILLEDMNKIKKVGDKRQILLMENGMGQTPLHSILFSPQPEAIKLLFKKMKELLLADNWRNIMSKEDKIFGTILHTTVLINNPDIVRLIFKKGMEILKTEFCQLLLNRKKSRSILHSAIFNKNPEVVKLVLNEVKEVFKNLPGKLTEFLMMTDEKSRTVLHLAAGNEEQNLNWEKRRELRKTDFVEDRSELVHLFLSELEKSKRGEFLKMKDESGKTALYIAAEVGKLEAVKLLLQEACSSGENLTNFVQEGDIDNRTALEIACSTDNDLVRDMLNKFLEEKKVAEPPSDP